MKKASIILMALALALGLTQCKKTEQPTTDNTENTFDITLSVSGASTGSATGNSKVDVTPTEGTVVFEAGDKIYVGSGGKYVGSLIHNGNHQFVGSITNPVEGEPLQFFFLGNVTPEEALSAGATEEFSVIISDQTEHLPVISCAASEQDFSLTNETYTAHLLNKCALAKFLVTTPVNAPVCIMGFNNKVTVNFTDYSLTSSKDGEGVIMLPASAGQNVEQWAILLPQDAIEEGEEGSVYASAITGIRPAIPTILENGYLTDGIVVNATNTPVGTVKGLFTVSTGTQVFFSQGNLQYIGSASEPYWQFAEHQWDYLGNNGQGSSSQTVDRDLFGWGTSGYNHGATCYQPWEINTSYSRWFYAYGSQNYNLYDQTGQADWGYNPISNGGNVENCGWRTMTKNEWEFVLNTRTTVTGIRYAKANLDGVNGVILLPDDWNSDYFTLNNTNTVDADYTTNSIDVATWIADLEFHGAVFLPAAGSIVYNYNMSSVGSEGTYWSSSISTYQVQSNAFRMDFSSSNLRPAYSSGNRGSGYSVRLVRNAQ